MPNADPETNQRFVKTPCTHYQKETNKDITKRANTKTEHQRYQCQHYNTCSMKTNGIPLYKNAYKIETL